MSLRDELAFHFLFRSRSVTRIADLERQLKEAFQSLFVQVVLYNDAVLSNIKLWADTFQSLFVNYSNGEFVEAALSVSIPFYSGRHQQLPQARTSNQS